MHIHQHKIIGAAGSASRQPGFDRRFAVGRDGRAVTKTREERPRKQRVDLVVLGNQDRESFVSWSRRFRAFYFDLRRGMFESIFDSQTCRQRSGAHRLDQVAGEAGRLERRQFVPVGGP